jgi:hypothetical protein
MMNANTGSSNDSKNRPKMDHSDKKDVRNDHDQEKDRHPLLPPERSSDKRQPHTNLDDPDPRRDSDRDDYSDITDVSTDNKKLPATKRSDTSDDGEGIMPVAIATMMVTRTSMWVVLLLNNYITT